MGKMKNKYKIIEKLFKNMGKDRISEISAQCAYYTILSFIPFVILLITLVQYSGISPESLYIAISNVIPKNMEEMILGIIQEVYSKSLGTISISIIFTIWAAGKGLFALVKGLQTVYKTKPKQFTTYIYIRIKAILETIIFVMLLLGGLVALVFGESIKNLISNYPLLLTVITKMLLVIITIVVFLLLYKYLPNHKVTFKSQILGAIIGGILLNVVSFIFANYLSIFKGFSLTYGSLTTLMLIMMWTFSCFYTVFIGAEINKLYNKIKQKD